MSKETSDLLKALEVGKFKGIQKMKRFGTMEARRLTNDSIVFYWRHTHGGKTVRVMVGPYSSKRPPLSLTMGSDGTFSIAAAFQAANAMEAAHAQALESNSSFQEQRESTAKAAKAEKAAVIAKQVADNQAKLDEQAYTLRALLVCYCDYLQALGRRSHLDARTIFTLHVFGAWPKVASTPAKDVQDEQIADMMRRLVEVGKGRTANKLRSYVRAAFQVAKVARTKATIPVHFKAFNVRHNPAADTSPDETANKPDKNPLSLEEIRQYWTTIKGMTCFKGAVLRLHLLTGGQRIEQLVRLKTADIKADNFIIYDGKGRPGQAPRPHALPLTTEAREALEACKPAGMFAISTTKGMKPIVATSLSGWAAEAGAASGIQDFQAKRIRSGVETLLAKARISKDDRGRLQSHGVSGVQARHYDGHDYMEEKRSALVTLFKLLDGPMSATVVPIRGAA
jgi:integrase